MPHETNEPPASSPQVSTQPLGCFNQPAQIFLNKRANLETGIFCIKKKKKSSFCCCCFWVFLLSLKNKGARFGNTGQKGEALAPSSSHERLTRSLVSHHPPQPHCSWTDGGSQHLASHTSTCPRSRELLLCTCAPWVGKGRISKETHVTLTPQPPLLTPSAWCSQVWVHKHKCTNKCKWLHKVHGLKTGKGKWSCSVVPDSLRSLGL